MIKGEQLELPCRADFVRNYIVFRQARAEAGGLVTKSFIPVFSMKVYDTLKKLVVYDPLGSG